MMRAAVGLGVLVGVFAIVDGAVAQPGPEPFCQVSDDPDYARRMNAPVQVGGGPVYGAARQKRYLEALRGPRGEAVTFQRKGSVGDPNVALIDRYEVTHEGLSKPIELYLDFYHYTDALVPQGFTCGNSFNLGLPPPDPFMAMEQMQTAAVESAAAEAEPPVELGTGTPAVMIVDHFRRMRDSARASVGAGRKPDADAIRRESLGPQTIVVAYPKVCGERQVLPAAIGLADPQGRTASPESTTADADAMRTLLAGSSAPVGSLAGVFRMAALPAGLAVTVSYREPGCADQPTLATYPIEGTGAQLLESPMPRRAAGDSAVGQWIAIQAIVDHRGSFQAARALGGPSDLSRAALEALANWKAEPARTNGVPVPVPVVIRVTFEQADPPPQ